MPGERGEARIHIEHDSFEGTEWRHCEGRGEEALGLWLHGPDALLPTNSAGVPDVRANRDESKEVLDKFAIDFLEILSEDADTLKTAPHTTFVKRVDEVLAARQLILKYPFE